MREIKFRAYDTHTKIMLPIVDIIKFTKSEDVYITREGAYGVGINIQYQPYIELMQYTGLHDKNGKEIYEGDIIKYLLENHQTRELYYKNFVVAWNEETASYVIKNATKGTLCIDYVPRSGELIGNIYENSELLED